jgi:hypothetical protein
MTEQEHDQDPYWQQDLLIGEGRIHGERTSIRLQVHTTEEPYWEHQDLVPLSHPTGQRVYVHARPYVLEPEYILTIDVHPRPTTSGELGKVVESEWEGMRHQHIGNCQGWFYPADRLLILWEVFLFPRYMEQDPRQDQVLKLVWTGFEGLLREKFSDARRIVVPSWEDEYQLEHWQEFLRTQGYAPLNQQAFGKDVEVKAGDGK